MKLSDLHATSRLHEVYTLWHQSAEAYEDPGEFRTYLNACIQAIRNVTFILQSQKSEIENFEIWYSEWQTAMKNDQIMKWCVATRNKIVKAGDLEKHSEAIVSYIASYFEPPKFHFRVSPFSSATEIAHEVAINFLLPELRNDGFLKVEKRWVSVDFPKIELLELLAYAFSFLANLLADVEKRNGPTAKSNTEEIEQTFNKSTEFLKINKADMPLCMAAFEDIRTQWLKLPHLEFTQAVVAKDQKIDPPKEKIIKRYGGLPSLSPSEEKIESGLRKQATLILKQAKKNLIKDKRLVTVAFLINPNKEMSIVEINYENYEDKYLVWESVAKEVFRRRATAIITVGEM